MTNIILNSYTKADLYNSGNLHSDVILKAIFQYFESAFLGDNNVMFLMATCVNITLKSWVKMLTDSYQWRNLIF